MLTEYSLGDTKSPFLLYQELLVTEELFNCVKLLKVTWEIVYRLW